MHWLPGAWLLAIARLIFDDAVLADVVQPTIADLQREWIDAGSNTRARMLAVCRGYLAFWSLMAISPVAFRNWRGRQKKGRPLARVAAVTAAVMLLLFARRTNMDIWLLQLLDRLPEGTLSALGSSSDFAFLIGPMILAAMMIRRRKGDGIQAGEVVLACLASITVATFLGTAGLVGAFQDIGLGGSAGVGQVTDGVVGATRPIVVAIISSLGCLLVFGAAVLARRRSVVSEVPTGAHQSMRHAVGWSILLAGVIVAVDQLLRLHHKMTEFMLQTLGPPQPAASGQLLASRAAEIFPLLLAAGALLSVVVFALSLGMWRASRARVSHPLLTWSSVAALVTVLVGGTWHASVVQTDLNTFRDNLAEMRAKTPGSR
jgi:hypothetical protein